MKRVLSVSLGSAKRDKQVKVDFGGELVLLERVGTDGSLKKAQALFEQEKNRVAAFGLGGIDLYIYSQSRRYIYKEAEKLVRAAGDTPVLDGSGLKNTLEKNIITDLECSGEVNFAGKNILMVCGVDRYGMTTALSQTAGRVFFGDAAFALHLPWLISSYSFYQRLTRLLLPIIIRLPLKLFYPQGQRQETQTTGLGYLFKAMDIICGDFHFIRRYMPKDMTGKLIITNTVTAADKELLKKTGCIGLITTTPYINGRSFGTNVFEAALVALSGQKQALSETEYNQLINKYGLKPSIEWF